MKKNVQSRLERLEGYKAGDPSALFFAVSIVELGTVSEAGWTAWEGFNVPRLSSEDDATLSQRATVELLKTFNFAELFSQMIVALHDRPGIPYEKPC